MVRCQVQALCSEVNTQLILRLSAIGCEGPSTPGFITKGSTCCCIVMTFFWDAETYTKAAGVSWNGRSKSQFLKLPLGKRSTTKTVISAAITRDASWSPSGPDMSGYNRTPKKMRGTQTHCCAWVHMGSGARRRPAGVSSHTEWHLHCASAGLQPIASAVCSI